MAKSKIQGITVEIGGDTTKLGNALDGVNKKSKSHLLVTISTL